MIHIFFLFASLVMFSIEMKIIYNLVSFLERNETAQDFFVTYK